MDESLKMEDSNCLSCIFDKLKTKVKQEAVRLDHIIPYISKDGKYRDIDTGEGIYMWTNGFWAGICFWFILEQRPGMGIIWICFKLSIYGRKKFLDASKRSAHYCIANLSLNDWLPVVDFRSPEHFAKFDSTAGMAIAAGLLELAEQNEYEKELYNKTAVKILQACESKFCNWNFEEDGIVTGGTVLYHSKENANVPIIYGDYFLTEAVIRLRGKHILLW